MAFFFVGLDAHELGYGHEVGAVYAYELLRIEGLLDVGKGAFLEVASVFCEDLDIVIVGLDVVYILCGYDADEAVVFYYDVVLVTFVYIVFEQGADLGAVFVGCLLQPFLNGFVETVFCDRL